MHWPEARCPRCGGPAIVEHDWTGRPVVTCDAFRRCAGDDLADDLEQAADRERLADMDVEMERLRIDLIEAHVDERPRDAAAIDAEIDELEARRAEVAVRLGHAEATSERRERQRLAAWREMAS